MTEQQYTPDAILEMASTEYRTLYNLVKSGEVVAGTTDYGTRHRFFVTKDGTLCYYRKGSSRYGYKISMADASRYVKLHRKLSLSPEQLLKKEYSVIAKYKRMASEASFTNRFIQSCLAVPDFETWKNDLLPADYWDKGRVGNPKSLYDLGLTTGTRIDGKVISLARIAKQYPRGIERLRESIRTKTPVSYIISRGKFAGYDITISTEGTAEAFQGFLSLEYAGCGNGYYYLLINDDNFIGYDVD